MVGVQMKRVKRRKAWLSGLEGNKIWPNRATNKQKSSKSNNNNNEKIIIIADGRELKPKEICLRSWFYMAT